LNLWDIQDEMDAKRLKYKIFTLTNDGKMIQESALRLSLPPRTIFRGDDEILIYINSGG